MYDALCVISVFLDHKLLSKNNFVFIILFLCPWCPITSSICSVLSKSTNRTTSDQGDVSQNPDLHFYQMIYGVMVVVMVTLATTKCFFYTYVTLNASCKLHDTMFKKVLWCG